jgi:GT2 family glycosyltransferase
VTDPVVLVAVIIPHYNDAARLARCLRALLPQLTQAVELVVIDNGSSEDLAGIRAAFPGLKLVTEPRKGAAEARNRGVAETTAPALFFLDCDCVPAPDWLAQALRLRGAADIVGGRIDVFDETAPPRSGAQVFEAVFAFDNRAYVQAKGFSVTANLLTRRDVFAATGPFVAGLSEDLDWCHRARAKGFALVYADDLAVGHPSRGDWPALARKWRRLTQEGFAQQGGRRAVWALKALAMPLSVLAHLPRMLRAPGLSRAERARGAGTLLRLRLARMAWMLGQALG